MSNEKAEVSSWLAEAAILSLIEEVELTPKPGLVDLDNNGSHQDLSIHLMRKSALSLKETFARIAYISHGRTPSLPLRREIATIGREGETCMFETTGGVNTHKGAIWAMGLLVSAAAMGTGSHTIKEVLALAGETARFSDCHSSITVTNGMRVQKKYGVLGARGEAQREFPHIRNVSLPMLHRSRANGLPENEARLHSLLALISVLDDTCILHRGGRGALLFAKKRSAEILSTGRIEGLDALNEEFMLHDISPGGSADLLAATLFLDKLEPNRIEVEVQNVFGCTY
ncbi:triphosphoribosyl-dephospho-CoA synthase [Bacillus sp. mrc49]|uniref:triphosphoribosyl-dephospho-CoA synthase n=1 Tax=Bacillus sp. mrc49 TaxID=2054913 RepID=UPI000C26F1D7|nr:triphosphoribosyl-dephospho-CoA synthase [Bacillus sp. mrc49]PJN91719.1 triphosphoribosyl-dephospho-CoA synthase [Bacillus sp. mrc49]